MKISLFQIYHLKVRKIFSKDLNETCKTLAKKFGVSDFINVYQILLDLFMANNY